MLPRSISGDHLAKPLTRIVNLIGPSSPHEMSTRLLRRFAKADLSLMLPGQTKTRNQSALRIDAILEPVKLDHQARLSITGDGSRSQSDSVACDVDATALGTQPVQRGVVCRVWQPLQ